MLSRLDACSVGAAADFPRNRFDENERSTLDRRGWKRLAVHWIFDDRESFACSPVKSAERLSERGYKKQRGKLLTRVNKFGDWFKLAKNAGVSTSCRVERYRANCTGWEEKWLSQTNSTPSIWWKRCSNLEFQGQQIFFLALHSTRCEGKTFPTNCRLQPNSSLGKWRKCFLIIWRYGCTRPNSDFMTCLILNTWTLMFIFRIMLTVSFIII